MKKLVILLFTLILIPSITAETLFDGWVGDMETFKAGDHYFYIQYVDLSDSLVFKMDDMGGIMELGECETRDNIKYCFQGVNYPEIEVKIVSLEPDITIERTFSTTTPKLSEQITVTVILKNEGDKRGSIKYTDPYPLGLRVYGNANTKVWEGGLNAGEETTFTYTIKAEDMISYDSTATVLYTFSGNEKTKESSEETIEVQTQFTIEQEISKKAVDKNEEISYNITITNEDDTDRLTISNLEITLPSQVDLVKFSTGLRKDVNKLIFSGTLEKDESKNLGIKIKSSKVGKFTIKTKAAIKLSDRVYEEELEQEVSVGLSYILPIINITDSVKSNTQLPIYIAVKNYGDGEIEDVNIKVESELFSNINRKKDITGGSTYEVLKKTITAPYLEEDKKHNIKVSGSYLSSSGRTYTFEKSAQVTVKAAEKIIKITRELNKEEFYPGEEIKITVKIKNQKNQIINDIDVSDIFPVELRSSLLGDVTAYLEKLEAKEEKKAYSYSLEIPEDYGEDEIEFKTTVNTEVGGELTILKRTDTVKVLKDGEPTSEEEQEDIVEEEETPEEEINETQEETEEPEEEPKQGFFKRIINWIKNIFKKDKS